MQELRDELDLRFHKGTNPDVYYRCPTLETLNGALRNELERSASSFIPLEIATEFVFATTSTLTIPASQQPSLDALIEPADFPQSITVGYALCRDIDGKDRLKVQRAIAKSIVVAVSQADNFQYVERAVHNKEGGDGIRLKFVCQDGLQGRYRKSKVKKEKSQGSEDSEDGVETKPHAPILAFDCGGAIHIKFSIKRDAINVVYKHNPIHSRPANGDSTFPSLPTKESNAPPASIPDPANEKKPRKRKRMKKDEVQVGDDYRDPDLDMSTSPEAPESSTKKKRKNNGTVASPVTSRTKKSKNSKQSESPTRSRKRAPIREPSPQPKPAKGKACIRCREKRIKCNEAKPTCNQCRRGLWACHYETTGDKKRSKHGCLNCKQRRRKCTEERPSCAYCIRLDDDCEYAEYS